jgi:hypothetical protein
MGKAGVYEAILRRIQATELAQQSNAVLHEELKQVKQASGRAECSDGAHPRGADGDAQVDA